MARVSTYLNFMGNTFEAFEFYRSVFGTDYSGPVLRNASSRKANMRVVDSPFMDYVMATPGIVVVAMGGHDGAALATDTLRRAVDWLRSP